MTAAPATSLDTVDAAARTPDLRQPYAELGLTDDEYARIRHILGRRPTSSELAMYSVMWSEHCSYKSSKVHLRRFGEATSPGMREKLLVGIGENAGVVDIGDGWAVTFKIESHNHPSYVEPYQGAATGVGGIVRDIMAMGARPIAVMDSLRFGDLRHPDTHRVLPGVVAGVGGYGNCLGLANIGGEVVFDPVYQGNPLVNALCVGAMRHDEIHLANARGEGNLVVLFGARTGGDGIGGVSVLASETFDEDGPTKRPAVQVGDPFAEKVLIECCLELFAANVVDGIQDLGGAGLSCATSELASNGDGGMVIYLERVPAARPEPSARGDPDERVPGADDGCRPPGRPRSLPRDQRQVGRRGGRPRRGHRERTPRVALARRDDRRRPPAHRRPRGPGLRAAPRTARPAWTPLRGHPDRLPRPTTGEELRATVLRLVASANLCSRAWVTDQYDRYVRGNTALAMPDDAGVVRVDEEHRPRCGARRRRQRPVRRPRPVRGRPARPRRGLPERRRPRAPARSPSPTASTSARRRTPGSCGSSPGRRRPRRRVRRTRHPRHRRQRLVLQPDRRRRDPPDAGHRRARRDRRRGAPDAVRLADAGQAIYLLGATGTSSAARSGRSPSTATSAACPRPSTSQDEKRLADIMVNASRDGLVDAAHDLSEGGLAQALVEACLRFGVGARVWLDEICERDGIPPFAALFSESTARAVVAVPRGEEVRFTDMCAGAAHPVRPDRSRRRRGPRARCSTSRGSSV